MTFGTNTKEYKALEYACARMNEEAERLGALPLYYVGECWLDFGARMMWTTIIYDENGDGFQALYPNEHKLIVNGSFDVEGIVQRQRNLLHTPVTTKCYGEEKVWNKRSDAIRFFKLGMENSDGSEKERYTNIIMQLIDGLDYASDED